MSSIKSKAKQAVVLKVVGVGAAIGGVVLLVKYGLPNIKDMLDNAAESVDNIADNAAESVDNIADNAAESVDNIVDTVGNLVSGNQEIVTDLGGGLIEAFKPRPSISAPKPSFVPANLIPLPAVIPPIVGGGGIIPSNPSNVSINPPQALPQAIIPLASPFFGGSSGSSSSKPSASSLFSMFRK